MMETIFTPHHPALYYKVNHIHISSGSWPDSRHLKRVPESHENFDEGLESQKGSVPSPNKCGVQSPKICLAPIVSKKVESRVPKNTSFRVGSPKIDVFRIPKMLRPASQKNWSPDFQKCLILKAGDNIINNVHLERLYEWITNRLPCLHMS